MIGEIIFQIIGQIILGLSLFAIASAQPLIVLFTLKYIDKLYKKEDR